MRFMVETDLQLSGNVSADTLALIHAEGYRYQDGNPCSRRKGEPYGKRNGRHACRRTRAAETGRKRAGH